MILGDLLWFYGLSFMALWFYRFFAAFLVVNFYDFFLLGFWMGNSKGEHVLRAISVSDKADWVLWEFAV